MEAGNKMMDSMRFDSDESDDNGNGNMLDGLGSGKPKKTEAKKANPIERQPQPMSNGSLHLGRISQFKQNGNMSTTMGIGMSGIIDANETDFFNNSDAKDLFGPTEFKPDVMQIP